MANAQTVGCTYQDMFTEALQYPSWSDFSDNDLTQQRYCEATDSLSHLCNNVYPGILLIIQDTLVGIIKSNELVHVFLLPSFFICSNNSI